MSLLRLAVLALLVVPGAAAMTVEVPAQVWGDDVAFRVTGVGDATQVNLTIGSQGAVVAPVVDGQAFYVARDVPPGVVAWQASTWNGTAVNGTVRGHVFVEAQVSLDALALNAEISRVLRALETLNVTGAQDVELDLSAVLVRLGALEANLTQEPLNTASRDAEPVVHFSAGSVVTAVLAVATLGLLGWLQWQAHRRHKEHMVLVLALASKMQVGPDSPEFQTALAAVED